MLFSIILAYLMDMMSILGILSIIIANIPIYFLVLSYLVSKFWNDSEYIVKGKYLLSIIKFFRQLFL